MGGRVLVRFLQAALDAKSSDQISTLRAELDFVQCVIPIFIRTHQPTLSSLRSAIAKVGQRIPLAFRFAKMLEDLILKRCGPASGIPAQITFPRPREPAVLQELFRESCAQGYSITLHESLHEPGTFMSLA